MKSAITSIRLFSSILAAGVALGSVACSAAPDGDPSHDPASTSSVGDQAGDNGDKDHVGHVAPSVAAPALVGAAASSEPGVGGGGAPHGPTPEGDGKHPHGETRQ